MYRKGPVTEFEFWVQMFKRYEQRWIDACAKLWFLSSLCVSFNSQSCYRGYKARGEVKKLKAAILIQSNVRGMIQRRRYCHAKQLVIVLQSTVRARRCQRNHGELKHAAILLQRKARANIACRKAREEFLAAKHAAVKLQSCYRGWKARCIVHQIGAAILIQRWFRSNVAGRRAREEYRKLKEAAVILQAAYRGYCARVFSRDVRAARIIQAAIRGFITRKRIEVRHCFFH